MAKLTRVTASLLKFKSKLANTIEYLLQDMMEDVARLEYYGGKADYNTDNLQAWELAMASGKKTIILQPGQYRFSNGITLPAGVSLIGTTCPELGFGTLDDKQFLRDGYINRLPGTCFIFSGTGTNVATMPNRGDYFTSSTYCMRVVNTGEGSLSSRISGLGIVQDMRVRKPDGTYTKPSEDGRANYQVGIYIDDAARNVFSEVCVFGYFDHAGVVIASKSGNDDPDYNTFNRCTMMGRKGIAVISDTSTPASFGLSGTRLNSCGLYTLDHHSRADMSNAELIAYYADASNWSPHYVDGDVSATTAEINGHYLYGCEIRTRCNTAIELDHASNIQYVNCIFEQSPYGITNSDTPAFKATNQVKKGVSFIGCRINYNTQIFNSNFAGVIPVGITIVGDPLFGRTGVSYNTPDGTWSVAILGSSGSVGDAAVQFTQDISSQNTGWRIGMDISSNNLLDFRWNGQVLQGVTTDGIRVPMFGERRLLHEVGPVLFVASDSITVTRSYHPISPESGNTDDLVTINGGVDGMRLIIRPTSSAHVITVKRTGNIRLDGGTDKVLSGSLSTLELMYRGTLWVQTSPMVTAL